MLAAADANVVVSRQISPAGPPAQVLIRWENGEFELLVADQILAEYERVLNYPHLARRHGMDAPAIGQLIADIRAASVVVTISGHLAVIADDPKDDKFLECAVAGGADVIVSGDKHLLRLGSYRGIRVLSPADFLALLDAPS